MRTLVILTLLTILTSCRSEENQLKDFTTDGCSMFMDRSYVSEADWTHCCVKHDIAYYGGGEEKLRLEADLELKSCIEKVDTEVLANLVFKGVRVGGSPYSVMPYRWGYGWTKNNYYNALSKEQKSMVLEKTKNIDIYDKNQIESFEKKIN